MRIGDIISKYLGHSATEEEKKFLLQWLEEKEENRNKFKKTYDLWLYSNSLLTDDAEMEAALARLNKRTSSLSKTSTPIRSFGLYLIRMVAVTLLLFSVGYTGYYIRGNKGNAPVVINKLITGIGGKGQFVLPDGSTVWLNANSVLEYPETFAGEKRMVRLEGEALFEVKKEVNNPFFVQAGGMDIEVLGTRFLVQNYSHKSMVEAVLINGSLKIGGDYFSESCILAPGQLITSHKNTLQTHISEVDTVDYTNWIHPKLVFDKTNLANVIINLKKWYGIEIEAVPGLTTNIHLSFTIRRESLEEVVKYMSLTAPISYKWENNTLYLSSKK